MGGRQLLFFRKSLDALRSYEILDTEPESAFDDIAELAAHICDTPIAVVNFVHDKGQ